MSHTDGPLVSVVLCTYDPDLYEHFVESAESVLDQTYPNVELVVVVDGTASVHEGAIEEFGNNDRVTVHANDTNLGLSASRNAGFELSDGDIVAFIDDDAVARPDWIEQLVDTYVRRDAIAAGGRMTPRWIDRQPRFLPPEFYWLIGVTHDGYPETETEVRNTFGSNISFRRRVLADLGGFDESFGLRADGKIQSEESELCARMKDRFGQGVWYNPAAVVEHKIFERRTRIRWQLSRAFWQGYTKAVLERHLTADAIQTESDYLSGVVLPGMGTRLRSLLTGDVVVSLLQLGALSLLTATTGLGYLYGRIAG